MQAGLGGFGTGPIPFDAQEPPAPNNEPPAPNNEEPEDDIIEFEDFIEAEGVELLPYQDYDKTIESTPPKPEDSTNY